MDYLGDFPTNGKVYHLWSTTSAAGASITRGTDGTLTIFKGNPTTLTWETQRTTLNGVTQKEDFDGATGIHSVYIDLSNNDDAGFYAAGGEYQVCIVGTVVDGQTINYPIFSFSIERAGGVLATLKSTPAELAAVPAAASSFLDRLGWLFLLARNKITQTSTQQAVRNDADSANVATASVSDDGTTFTRGEFS